MVGNTLLRFKELFSVCIASVPVHPANHSSHLPGTDLNVPLSGKPPVVLHHTLHVLAGQ
jgi:hypothetical protein